MSVHGFTGYWGSGKTLTMTQEINKRVRECPERTIVAHNFGYHGHPLGLQIPIKTMDDIIAFAKLDLGKNPDGSPMYTKLIGVDEIGMLLRARGHATWPPAGDVVFMQGRKMGVELLWTTQHWRFVDVNVRRVTTLLTDCTGFFPKRLNPGEKPRKYRPRVIRKRVFIMPNPESGDLPKDCDQCSWSLFSHDAAGSYDTYKLVQVACELLEQQAADPSSTAVGSEVALVLPDYVAVGSDGPAVAKPPRRRIGKVARLGARGEIS